MKLLTMLLACMLASAHANESASAALSINVDTTLAEKVLATVCSDSAPDETYFRNASEVNVMLDHFSQFRPYFTMENYLNELRSAASCESSTTNYFRFNQVVREKHAISHEIRRFNQDVELEITQMLTPHAPGQYTDNYRAVVMVGTPSCGGWASDAAFFIDLPCIQKDPEGLTYLIAHETYHLLQNTFMPRDENASYQQKFLFEMLREGSAMVVADITEITSPGEYTRKSLASLKKNNRRETLNHDLFRMLISQLALSPTKETWQQVYNIGFSGSYDAPMYSVGAAIITQVIEVHGMEQYLLWMSTKPLEVFTAYAKITGHSWLETLNE